MFFVVTFSSVDKFSDQYGVKLKFSTTGKKTK